MSELAQVCPDNSWCNYQAVDFKSIYVQIFLLVLIIVTAAAIAKYFYQLLQFRNSQSREIREIFGITFIKVFVLLASWAMCSIVKVTINIIAFYLYINKDQQCHPTKSSPNVVLSLIFLTLDNTSTFIVVQLIIFIPFQWLELALRHITDVQPQIPITSRKLLSFSFTVTKILRVYLLIRYALVILYFLEPILAVSTSIGCKMAQYLYFFPYLDSILHLIIQSGAVLVFYGYGYCVADNMKKNKIIRMRKEDFKRIKFQFSLLAIALLSRIFLNMFFNGFAPKILDYNPGSTCLDPEPGNGIKRAMFLLFGQIFMHIMPITVVLLIYRPNIEQKKRDENILKCETSTLSYEQTKIDGESSSSGTSGNINQSQSKFSVENSYKKL